ncbi:Anillin domain-containing protein [Meloidogyne graminicola]|uniref:Anillin domain-containing protein n=1 Tax=Meloidogyne graminicola TaxID=189291 RepID=A0A8T0A392_9BILA|nr:Anillin domain-containing protein [Meloidogyne graminicola]
MSSSSSKPFSSENQNNIIGFILKEEYYVRFRLANATLNGKTHSYVLEKTSNHLLPLYGNISVQLLVQPNSLISPLAQGSLDIFLTNEGILYQHMYCVLQGGQLRCWDAKVENEVLDSKQIMSKTPTICLQIIGKERIERTSFPTAFRILSDNKNLLCICLSKHSLIGWRNSIYLQQNDNIVWAEFAQIQHNPYSVAFGETSNNINVKDDNNNSNIFKISQNCGNNKIEGKISRSVSHILQPSRISVLKVKIINEQNNNQKIKKCNKNLYNNIENNKFENIKSTKQISHNYVLSLQINDIDKFKKSYINEKINSEKTKEFKTTNYDEVNNNKIIKDKQERPFNINLDYYSNITQQKITRNKEKCFETWHSPKKSSDCTRL